MINGLSPAVYAGLGGLSLLLCVVSMYRFFYSRNQGSKQMVRRAMLCGVGLAGVAGCLRAFVLFESHDATISIAQFAYEGALLLIVASVMSVSLIANVFIARLVGRRLNKRLRSNPVLHAKYEQALRTEMVPPVFRDDGR